jgi:hypothetical protein
MNPENMSDEDAQLLAELGSALKKHDLDTQLVVREALDEKFGPEKS